VGETTAISWTDHTFNPWMGCTKVSPGCDHCYAEGLGKRTGKVQWGDDAERVLTSDGYWKNPLKWNRAAEAEGRRHRVFCASMADVFEDRADLIAPRQRLFDLIYETPWLDWQLLTKRPQNVGHWDSGEWVGYAPPPNVWIGTTAEDQERASERLPLLMNIPAAVRFLSCEPLLGPIDLTRALGGVWQCRGILADDYETVGRFDNLRDFGPDWVIVGGESGPGHRPLNLDWARTIRDDCAKAGIAYFFKQVGGRTPTAGGDLLDGVMHKEFPHVA